jgi:hypothetical protein
MRAASIRQQGSRVWSISGGVDGEDLVCWTDTGRPASWSVCNADHGSVNISRDTARLILRGLLAESVGRELVEWVSGDHPIAESFACWSAVLAKLRELGMVS